MGRFSGIGNCYQVLLPTSSAATVNNAISSLTSQPGVTSAEADVLRSLSFTPTCISPTCGSQAWNQVNLGSAQGLTFGKGVAIAILDTGVDKNNTILSP